MYIKFCRPKLQQQPSRQHVSAPTRTTEHVLHRRPKLHCYRFRGVWIPAVTKHQQKRILRLKQLRPSQSSIGWQIQNSKGVIDNASFFKCGHILCIIAHSRSGGLEYELQIKHQTHVDQKTLQYSLVFRPDQLHIHEAFGARCACCASPFRRFEYELGIKYENQTIWLFCTRFIPRSLILFQQVRKSKG